MSSGSFSDGGNTRAITAGTLHLDARNGDIGGAGASAIDVAVSNLSVNTQSNNDAYISSGQGINFSANSSVGSGALTLVSVAGDVTDSAGVGVTASTFAATLSDGASDITLDSDSHAITNLGAITAPGGFILDNGSNSLTLTGDLSTTDNAVSIDVSSGTLDTNDQAISAGSGNITLTADAIDLGTAADKITTTGALVMQPDTAGTSIGIGGGAGDFNLADAEIAAIADGSSAITIGRSDGEHTITINEVSFTDPLIVRAPSGGSISVAGDLTGVGGASITLTGTTTLSADVTTANQDITFSNAVALGADATVDSGAGAGDITFSSTIDGDQALVVNSGTGDTTFSGAVGGATALDTLTTETGGATTIGANMTVQGATMTFNDAVVFGSGVTLTNTNGNSGNITFESTLTNSNGNSKLVSDNIRLNGASGSVSGTSDLTLVPYTIGASADMVIGSANALHTIIAAPLTNYAGRVVVGNDLSNATTVDADTITVSAPLTVSGSLVLLATNDISLNDTLIAGTSSGDVLTVVSKSGNILATDGVVRGSADKIVMGAGGLIGRASVNNSDIINLAPGSAVELFTSDDQVYATTNGVSASSDEATFDASPIASDYLTKANMNFSAIIAQTDGATSAGEQLNISNEVTRDIESGELMVEIDSGGAFAENTIPAVGFVISFEEADSGDLAGSFEREETAVIEDAFTIEEESSMETDAFQIETNQSTANLDVNVDAKAEQSDSFELEASEPEDEFKEESVRRE